MRTILTAKNAPSEKMEHHTHYNFGLEPKPKSAIQMDNHSTINGRQNSESFHQKQSPFLARNGFGRSSRADFCASTWRRTPKRRRQVNRLQQFFWTVVCTIILHNHEKSTKLSSPSEVNCPHLTDNGSVSEKNQPDQRKNQFESASKPYFAFST